MHCNDEDIKYFWNTNNRMKEAIVLKIRTNLLSVISYGKMLISHINKIVRDNGLLFLEIEMFDNLWFDIEEEAVYAKSHAL